MKRLLFCCALVAIVALSSCDKSGQTAVQVNAKVLPGVWEIRAVAGGMVPGINEGLKPGNGYCWTFQQNNFAKMVKDSVERSGTYSVSKNTGTDLNTGRAIDQFIFNNLPAESFELTNDTLKVYSGMIAADGIIEMYVKISDDTSYLK